MDRRTAKREACWRGAKVIHDAMTQGWPSDQYDEVEYEQVSAGLEELVKELERRGHR